MAVWNYLDIKGGKIYARKTQKYAYTDSFGSLLTITYGFDNVAIQHTLFRKPALYG